MKNVTVSIPDDVYRRARIRAAELDTSLSRLVAEHLRSISAEDEFERLAAERRKLIASVEGFSVKASGDYPSREELHDRDALR